MSTLKSVLDGDQTAALVAKGMELSVAKEKNAMFGRAAARFAAAGVASSDPVSLLWVPGRIEVGGKHTDYAGGRSLLGAITKGFTVLSHKRADKTVRILTTFLKGTESVQMEASFQLSPDLEMEQGHWANYNRAVARRLCRNFPAAMKYGVDIAIECDLPEASGMSTSSAIICYMYMVLAAANDLAADPKHQRLLGRDEDLYAYLGFCENGQNAHPELPGDRGVGTFGGSEDHTAIMSCTAGNLNMFSYCPTKFEGSFTFPSDHRFVIMVSGYVAEKTGAKMGDYNNAAFLAFDAARAWTKAKAKANVTPASFGFPIFNAATTGECNLAEIVRYVRQSNPGWDDWEVKAAIAADIATFDTGEGPFPLGKAQFYPAGRLVERFSQFIAESEGCVPDMAAGLAGMAAGAAPPEPPGAAMDAAVAAAAKAAKAKGGDDDAIYAAIVAAAAAARDAALAAPPTLDPETALLTLVEATEESHRMTVQELRNTVEVTEWLPWRATQHPGCHCASAFGAGFGGSCWALVKAAAVDEFMATITADYKRHCQLRFMARHTETHSRNFEFLVCQQKFSIFAMVPGPGAFVL